MKHRPVFRALLFFYFAMSGSAALADDAAVVPGAPDAAQEVLSEMNAASVAEAERSQQVLQDEIRQKSIIEKAIRDSQVVGTTAMKREFSSDGRWVTVMSSERSESYQTAIL